MRRVEFWAVVCLLVCAPLARATSNHDAENALRDSLSKQQLVLRNFSGEDKVEAAWDGSEIKLDAPRWRTMAQVEVSSIKVKGHRLVMSCSSHVLVKDKDGNIGAYAAPSKIEIDVDLGGADPAVILPRLKNALFYSSLDEALAALPKEVRGRVPGRADMDPFKRTAVSVSKPICDCAAQDKTACVGSGVSTQGMAPPVVVKQNNPEMTDESRHAGPLDVHVDVAFTVNEAGQPQDLWILKPAGLGLDAAAAKSVLKYVFRPATCHQKPVAVYLEVDVRFQRY